MDKTDHDGINAVQHILLLSNGLEYLGTDQVMILVHKPKLWGQHDRRLFGMKTTASYRINPSTYVGPNALVLMHYFNLLSLSLPHLSWQLKS